MNYVCVSSMHKGHFDYIGGVMIDSWKKYWPAAAEMIVYAEGFDYKDADPRVKFINWEEHCKSLHDEFSRKTDDNSTLRFAKKGFAFLHAMETINNKKIIWIDADILFFKKITESLIDPLLPSNKLVALFDTYYQINPNYTLEQYIDYTTRNSFAAESGFLIINPFHNNYKKYVDNYRNLFTSPVKDSCLYSWYDGEVAVAAAKEFLIDVQDLSQLRLTNKTQTPLNKSHLSEYFNHQKGKVKKGYTVSDLRKFCHLE